MENKRNLKQTINTLTLVLIVIAVFVIFSALNHAFASKTNIMNIVRQVSVNGILAVGMTLVCLTGGIDLSVGSILGYAGIWTATWAQSGKIPVPIIFLGAILIGMVMGLINGYFVSYWRCPAFAVTLAMLTAGRGLTYIHCGGKPISQLSKSFLAIGKTNIAGILPAPTLFLIAVFVVFSLLLSKFKIGRYIYAVGGNEQAALVSGINVKFITMIVYVFSGICCGIAAFVHTSRVSAGLAPAGNGYELDAIAATVIGGTSLAGGSGKLWGTMLGVLLLGMVNTGLDLLNVNSFYQQVAKGLIILGAVMLDSKRGT